MSLLLRRAANSNVAPATVHPEVSWPGVSMQKQHERHALAMALVEQARNRAREAAESQEDADKVAKRIARKVLRAAKPDLPDGVLGAKELQKATATFASLIAAPVIDLDRIRNELAALDAAILARLTAVAEMRAVQEDEEILLLLLAA